LVISLDSQNQDYLPDLSGPTGNSKKLAAEFRIPELTAGRGVASLSTGLKGRLRSAPASPIPFFQVKAHLHANPFDIAVRSSARAAETKPIT
jgi:hypothetical protein